MLTPENNKNLQELVSLNVQTNSNDIPVASMILRIVSNCTFNIHN